MAGAVSSALGNGWLTIDSTANSGSGRTPQVNPGGDVPNPAVPTADRVIQPDSPDVAPASDQVLYAPSNWANAWPTFSQLPDGSQGLAQTPEANVNPQPRPAGPGGKGVAVRVTQNQYAGYDAHSQMTDNAGWDQNTPSGRSATRRLIGADGVGFRDFWYTTAERPTPKRFALRAAPNNSPDGTPGVLNGASLPNYADTAYGGPGNIAYSTPAPPAVQQIQAVQGAGPDWTWGQF